MNWHSFENKKILGTVPVEADGSVYVEVPSANRSCVFQLLDGERRMVQSMRSGTIIQPGETQGCYGCHDDRTASAPVRRPTAGHDAGPAHAGGLVWPAARVFVPPGVQPVFDRHCVGCHDFGMEAESKLILAGDRELVFNAAYTELWSKGHVAVIGGGPAEIQPAKSWGAHASKLTGLPAARTPRRGPQPEEIERVETWLDLNAPYYPVYESGQPRRRGRTQPAHHRGNPSVPPGWPGAPPHSSTPGATAASCAMKISREGFYSG
jgi:hypothetical protein